MTDKPSFQTDDYFELLALHRAIIEAKFHLDPEDRDVPGSPILARISERIVEAIGLMEDRMGKYGGSKGWESWRRNPGTRFWNVAVEYAANFSDWHKLNLEQKRKLVTNLMAPFIADDNQISAFLSEVDIRAEIVCKTR